MSRLRGEASVASFEGPLLSRSIPIDPPPFQSVLQAAPAPRTVWAAPDLDAGVDPTESKPTIVGSGAAAVLRADGSARFEQIRTQADALVGDANTDTARAARPRLFGGFAFHDDHEPAPPWTGFSGAQFVLPRIQITWGDDTAWLTTNAVGGSQSALGARIEQAHQWVSSLSESGSPAEGPGIHHRERLTNRETWRTAVSASIDRIRAGELRKVVLAQALRTAIDGELSITDTFSRLRGTYPGCFGFLIDATGDRYFLGATPERLVSLRGRTIHTGALAGTTGRGDTPEEDDRLARELRDSEKNAHEHDLVVNTVREQLDPFTTSITTGDRRVRRLGTVQHLETPVTAELAQEEHVLSLVEALHPTPAVGGLPPDRALATIQATEPFDRGWYAAPVGWFDAEGNGSFAVALRSTVTTRDVATLFAGVGIVSDSDPDDEWEEVQLKYRPVLDALE